MVGFSLFPFRVGPKKRRKEYASFPINSIISCVKHTFLIHYAMEIEINLQSKGKHLKFGHMHVFLK
jgi:hypothetical protein